VDGEHTKFSRRRVAGAHVKGLPKAPPEAAAQKVRPTAAAAAAAATTAAAAPSAQEIHQWR